MAPTAPPATRHPPMRTAATLIFWAAAIAVASFFLWVEFIKLAVK